MVGRGDCHAADRGWGETDTPRHVDAQIRFGVNPHVNIALISGSFCSQRTNGIKRTQTSGLNPAEQIVGVTEEEGKKSRGNENKHAVEFLCQWLAGLGVFLLWIPATGSDFVLDQTSRSWASRCFGWAQSWNRHHPVFFFFFLKKTNNLFPSLHLFSPYVAMFYFLFYSNIKAILLFVILLVCSTVSHCVTSIVTFVFSETAPFPNTPLIHFIAVCSCRLGNFSSKLPEG